MFKKTLSAVAGRSRLFFQASKTRNVTTRCLHRTPEIVFFKPPSITPTVASTRNYAKGKDIKKNKKKKEHIDEMELSEYFDLERLLADLEKPLEIFKKDLAENAALRSSKSAIENLKVPFHGKIFQIQDLAEVGKKNPKNYILDLSSFPDAVTPVMSVLQTSDLRLNVQQEGNKVIVPIPKVTKEYREVLAKKSKIYYFKCKESIRDIHLSYMRSFRATENLGDETKYRICDQMEALRNRYVKIAEQILKEKEYELLQAE